MKDFIKFLFSLMILIGGTALALYVLGPVCYEHGVSRTPCVRVYANKELVYEGRTYHYETATRGSATIFKEYEQTPFFPKKIQEIIVSDLRVETVACQEVEK